MPKPKSDEMLLQKRHVQYSVELGEEICRALATSTLSMYKLCELNDHWPIRQTINEWRLDRPEFREKYYEARKCQVDLLAEEIIEIADDTSKDNIRKVKQNGEEIDTCDNEWVNRSRLRTDSRKWLAMKLLPKIYGEKSEQKIEIAPHEDWIEKLK